MRKVVAMMVVLLGCAGCSGGIHGNVLEMRFASPMFGEEPGLPVVYPGRREASEYGMVQAFGPSWRNMEGDHPSYNFNP